jgi:hypothetical protein
VAQLLDLASLQVSESTKVRVLHAVTADDIGTDLARIGLWHDRGAQWEVHDYLVYNPSRVKVLAARQRHANRQERYRNKASDGVSDASRDAPVTGAPVPVPVPVPRSERSESLLFLAPASPPAAQTRAGRAKPKVPWPDGFELTAARAAYATRQSLDAAYEWGKFRTHALRDDVRHVNWDRAWEYWVRNAWEIARRHA